jgi:hypothetical protein
MAFSGDFGVASMKAGRSLTQGQGQTIVLILNPKDAAFNAQI